MVGRFVWRDLGPRYRNGRMLFLGRIPPEPGFTIHAGPDPTKYRMVPDALPVQRDSEGRAWAVNATPWPE